MKEATYRVPIDKFPPMAIHRTPDVQWRSMQKLMDMSKGDPRFARLKSIFRKAEELLNTPPPHP